MRVAFAIISLAVIATGCANRSSPRADLRAVLKSTYGPQTRVNVSFMGDSRHLNLLLDGPPFRLLADSAGTVKALEVGRLALQSYSNASQLESLTVRFVRFVPGAGESYCFARSTTFRVNQSRDSPDSSLTLVHQDIHRGPCLLDATLTP